MKASWRKKFDKEWKILFPWILEIVVDGEVVGLLCSLCRASFSVENTSLVKNDGVWTLRPFVRFGEFMSAA